MELPDRTMKVVLKDIILKSVVVIYTNQSPTHNKKAAIQKMLEAGEFVANYGVTMDQESFDRLGELSLMLVQSQRRLSTGWRQLLSHPVDTYRSARDLKANANYLLTEAQSASFRSRLREADEAREDRENNRASLQTQTVSSGQVQGAVMASTHPVNVATSATPVNIANPATPFPSALPRAGSDAVGPSAVGDDLAYIRLGELEMRIPLNGCTRLVFDGENLITRFRTKAGPSQPRESAPDDQQARAAMRTPSIFTATGSARIVPVLQPDTPGGDPSQNHDEEVSMCKFEWLEGPIITALTDLEDEEPDVMDGISDSGLPLD